MQRAGAVDPMISALEAKYGPKKGKRAKKG